MDENTPEPPDTTHDVVPEGNPAPPAPPPPPGQRSVLLFPPALPWPAVPSPAALMYAP